MVSRIGNNKILNISSLAIIVVMIQLVTIVLTQTATNHHQYNYKCFRNSSIDEMPGFGMSGISADDQIKILVSDRITHQLVSRIFAIQLREYFGFRNITFKRVEYYQEQEHIYRKMFKLLEEFHDQTNEQIINLEVWMIPDFNILHPRISIVGSMFNPGRYAFFLPRILLHPNESSLSLQQIPPMINEFSYEIFAKPDSSSLNEYVIDSHVLGRVDREFQRNVSVKNLVEYVPEHCTNKTCAHVLAPANCQFITTHINKLKLYIKVIFIRNSFNDILDRLIKLYTEDRAISFAKRKLVILHWYPSDVTAGHRYEMIQFRMPGCEALNMEDCKYELTPILKMCSKAFLNNRLAHYRLDKFFMDAQNLANLMSLYESKRNAHNDLSDTGTSSPPSIWDLLLIDLEQYFNDVACDYVKKTYNSTELKNQHKRFGYDNRSLVIGAWFLNNDIDKHNLVISAQMAGTAVNNYLSKMNGLTQEIFDMPVFQVQMVLIDCTSDKAMNNILTSYYEDTQVVGFIGPICEEMIESIAGLSKHFQLPYISYAGDGAFLTDRTKYPYIYRTIGENREIEKIYLNIFNQFGWTRVATLTEEGLKTANYLINLDELFKNNDKELVVNKKFDCNGRKNLLEQQLKYLKSINAYIIIADMSVTCVHTFACELYKFNMTSEYGYVWFMPDWTLRHIMNLNSSFGSCTMDQMREAINGHFSLKHISYVNDNATIVEQKTVKDWREAYYGEMGGEDNHIPNYAGFVYDSIWTYGIALNNLFKIKKHYKRSELVGLLANEISQISFDGVSGNVYFDETGSRLIDINLVQSQNMNLNVIGTYAPEFSQQSNKTVLNWVGHLNESAIVWFTKLGVIPTDGSKICSFKTLANLLNTSCEVATAVIICLGCILFVVLLSTGSFIFWKWKYDKKMEFIKKNGIDSMKCEQLDNTLDKWEIPKDRIVINRKLGEGAFGTVYGGEAQLLENGVWTAVAVKTLKMGSMREDRLNFLAEAETMKRFDHKNIIKLLGVCLSSEPIYTVMEYMLYGDLKTFLLARRHLVNEKTADDSDLSSKRLTQMALDIAKALAYLSNEKFVHRDIACRNCLVNANKLVKLGDFGMARSMFENDYYKFNRKGMLPVRWMAPESLVLGIFTPSSDIWSFGVLIYEVITFGAFPFQGLTNNEVLEFIKQGKTLAIPNAVKPQLEYLMRSCWKREYRERLKASEICDYLVANPRIITACIDDPLSSVQINDSETDQIELLKRLNIRPIGGETKTPNNNIIVTTTGSLKRENNMHHDVPPAQTRNLSYIEMNTLNLLPKQPNSSSLSPHYNPIEPLIVRSDSDISKSNTSLRRYVPMCGFNKNKSVPLSSDYESEFN